MITVSDSVICRKAVEKFGVDTQQIVAMEELGELIQAISKLARWEYDNKNLEELSDYIDDLSGEIADVEIMLEQLKHGYKCHVEVERWKDKKLMRLCGRIEEYIKK